MLPADRPERPDREDAWLAALNERHLENLTQSEVTRALRALSSCYVERRDKLASGGALDGAGKRAAFALFYGPQHYVLTRAIVASLKIAAKSSGRSWMRNRIGRRGGGDCVR